MSPQNARAAASVDAIRLGRWQQAAVYAATAVLVVSGAAWLVLHYFLAESGPYGPQIHPLEPWMMRVHGAAAMAGLVVYGALLPVHVRRAWSIRRNIVPGIGLLALMLLLTLGGYLLYYAGGENTRALVSLAHWIPGLLVAPLLVWHIIAGRARARAGQMAAAVMENRA